MMTFRTGNLLDSFAPCLVNTVNCVGAMGKGIALEFKNKYPELYKQYRNDYTYYEPGKCYFYNIRDKIIVNATTKNHWRDDSSYPWIRYCCQDFVRQYRSYDIKFVAFPLLGAGNGGLNPNNVKQIMKFELSKDGATDDIDIEIWTKE